jgi:SAM-dependent methyltransferase
MDGPYYDKALARVHHLAYHHHADLCAPGILALLEPVRARRGQVLELGCGSGALTRHLVAAGHRVIATDASPAFLDIAAAEAPGAEYRLLTLPDDPIPPADAVVAVGHVLNYLPTIDEFGRALASITAALRPGGVMAIDILTPEEAPNQGETKTYARVEDDWAIFTEFSQPSPERFGPDRLSREITTFIEEDGAWRREDETHLNLLVDPDTIARLIDFGLETTIADGFDDAPLPAGMKTLIAVKPAESE